MNTAANDGTTGYGRVENGRGGHANGSATSCELKSPVAYVKGVGSACAELLGKLGIVRAFDLLFFFPRDYLEVVLRRDATAITDDSVQSVAGEIQYFQSRRTRRGSIATLTIDVKGDPVEAIWFNMPYVSREFEAGRPVMLTGKPKRNGDVWQFPHPRLTYLDSGLDIPWREDVASDAPEEKRYVLPVYHLTAGLSQARLQRIVRNALATLPDQLEEALPEDLRNERGLAPIAEAIRLVHYPSTPEDVEYARRRFIYQELLVLQLALALCRARRLVNMRAPELPGSSKIDSRIRRRFPFELTPAQNNAIREISEDMGRPVPMNRLLQGDVGSGKTIVAVYAALQASANRAQTVVMSPTETLARQHLRTFEALLDGSDVKVVPFFGGQKASERAQILAMIESGEARIVVGTQALVCNELKFKNLGLVVIDEQHKFGVRQRAALKSAAAGLEPHYLVMTATPIPRSLTMTLFGDLDVSVMRGAPPGRVPPKTSIVTEKKRESWMKFVRARLDEGRQAYFIAPRVDDDGVGSDSESIGSEGTLWSDGSSVGESPGDDALGRWSGVKSFKRTVEESDLDFAESKKSRRSSDETANAKIPLKTVESVYKELVERWLPGYRVGILHGRASTAEKESVMRDFRDRKIQCLVATSVVEVGIDVPNATIMTIENAERFGLAQLHQLRGRVARGRYQGYCAVIPSLSETFPKKTSSKKGNNDALERLEFFCESSDGFALAERDFELRGSGEFFGAKQHGAATALRVANVARDRKLLEEARDDARKIVQSDPGLSAANHATLRGQVLSRYGRTLDLGDVG